MGVIMVLAVLGGAGTAPARQRVLELEERVAGVSGGLGGVFDHEVRVV